MDSSNMKRHHYYSIKLERNKVFAELLYNGTDFLLFGRVAITTEKNLNTGTVETYLSQGTYIASQRNRYSDYKTYQYYIIDLNSMHIQRVNKKNIFQYFSDKQIELEKFMSNENLKLKSPESYILIVEKYEQLKLHK